MAGPTTNQLDAFLKAERTAESGGNYQAYNAGGGASGAYQFIQSTWDTHAAAAGFSQYVGVNPSSAPNNVQDAVAAQMATTIYNSHPTWAYVAESWYYPAWAGTPTASKVPYPTAGNTESVATYGAHIVNLMKGYLGTAKLSTTASGGGGGSGGGSGSTPSSSGPKTTGTTAQPKGTGIHGALQQLTRLLNPATHGGLFGGLQRVLETVGLRGAFALGFVGMAGIGIYVIAKGTGGGSGGRAQLPTIAGGIAIAQRRAGRESREAIAGIKQQTSREQSAGRETVAGIKAGASKLEGESRERQISTREGTRLETERERGRARRDVQEGRIRQAATPKVSHVHHYRQK